MMVNRLEERRRWLAFFPEGTLEFLVVTRVLALLLLATLIIVPTTQRPLVLLAMMIILWCDYALLLGWLMQLVNDLERLFGASQAASNSGGIRVIDAAIALLPSAIALLVIAPWPAAILRRMGHPTLLMVALLTLYIASLPLGYAALRRMGFRSGTGTFLLLVPVLNWFALHRLLPGLHARVRERALELNLPVAQESGAGAAAVAADFCLMIGIVFWAAWVLLLWRAQHTGVSGGVLLGLVQTASLGAGCFMAVTQVAALEYLQRRYVVLVRRSQGAPMAEQGHQT
jgi:hypothetical protein